MIAAIPWHLGWTHPPAQPGPYSIQLDDVSEFVLWKNGEQLVIPIKDLFKALR